jgi:hypothetical protein
VSSVSRPASAGADWNAVARVGGRLGLLGGETPNVSGTDELLDLGPKVPLLNWSRSFARDLAELGFRTAWG